MLDDYHRGPVDYDPTRDNYSFNTVTIQPGTTVTAANFCQAAPNMAGIVCAGPLTLVQCNLTNVALDPAWSVQDCTTIQCWMIPGTGSQYICADPSLLTGNEVAPDGAVVANPV